MKLFPSFLLLLLLFCGCESSEDVQRVPPLFELLSTDSTGIDFVNTVENRENFNIFSYRNFYNGGGAAIGDVNNDGLPDIYLTANMGANKLYLNQGDWQFRDATEHAGVASEKNWSTGVALIDVNHDGWLDIYVCNAGYDREMNPRNELFINQQNGTFTEAAEKYGLADVGYTTHAAFFDYDLDGDLDVYLLNNSFVPVSSINYNNKRDLYAQDWNVRDFLKGGGDKLLRNDDGRYTDVSKDAGIYGSLIGFGLGVTVGDVNNDHYPDIYVSNDFFERDYLYLNQRDGTFKEKVETSMQHISLASMGADMADINNDGLPEIFVTEMLPETDYRRKTTVQFEKVNLEKMKQQRGFFHQYMHNTLQLNNGNGTFSEIANYSQVAASDWSWGALLFDADNDGYRDIFVSNGIYHNLTDQDFIDFFANDVIQEMVTTGEKKDIEQVIDKMPSVALPNKFFHNQQNLRFTDQSTAWGLEKPSFSNGAAYGDLDLDGDLDLVVNNVNQPAFIYRNTSTQRLNHNYISVTLEGDATNTFAIGAGISLFLKGKVQRAEVIPTRGFQSSMDYTQVFGLGETSQIDSLVVTWPDLSTSTVINPPVNQKVVLKWGNSKKVKSKIYSRSNTILRTIDRSFTSHREEDYLDLLNEGLVIRSLTNEGPAVAVGDLDGDDRDDIFIGGGKGQAGHIYLQRNDSFQLMTQPAIDRWAETEDVGASLFDADGDNDLDLYVGSAGNFAKAGAIELQDKLFINDGAGNFTYRKDALPRAGYNTAAVLPIDYDNDGDLDLFVGSRSLPQKYAMPVVSLLYENDGTGNFTDVTRERAPAFAQLGMVTDARWADLTGDGQPELITTSEWAAPRVLNYDGDRFEFMETDLDNYPGWWYALELADLDNDGDLDIVLGNRGENFYFSADTEHPAKLWVADFDNNGTTEKIMTQNLAGRDMPIAMKKELTEQLVSLKKKNLRHEDYANNSITQLFSKSELSKARVWEATYFKSAIAYNEGNGNFKVAELPAAAQLSSTNAILVKDINSDGLPDIIIGGNDVGFLPQFSRLDASYGTVLMNQRDRTFSTAHVKETGFFVPGVVRHIKEIQVGGQREIIVVRNNDVPLSFSFSTN